MKAILTEEQTAFFTKNGFLELEIAYQVFSDQHSLERDCWRHEPKRKDFLLHKLGPLALFLSGKKQLRLACTQWISAENRPKKAGVLKEMFSIQGLAIAAVCAQNPVFPKRRSPLGILPLPSPGHVLFFRTELILDWPHLLSDVYLAVYAFTTAVYVHNARDPARYALKQFGYQFGDLLKNETHPLILN